MWYTYNNAELLCTLFSSCEDFSDALCTDCVSGQPACIIEEDLPPLPTGMCEIYSNGHVKIKMKHQILQILPLPPLLDLPLPPLLNLPRHHILQSVNILDRPCHSQTAVGNTMNVQRTVPGGSSVAVLASTIPHQMLVSQKKWAVICVAKMTRGVISCQN